MLILLACVFAVSREEAAAAFATYVSEVKAAAPHGLQPDCIPLRVEADPSAPYVGTAVLFHGYSACPQQYFAMVPALVAKGFDVMLPLNPGHGNSLDAPEPRWTGCLTGCDMPDGSDGKLDDTTGLPNSARQWQGFVDQINAIAKQAPGVRVVGGISIGGSLAAAAGQEMDGDKPLYARQLILNPLIKLEGQYDTAAMAVDWVPILRSQYMGWGPGCRLERAAGRAGFCTFRIKNAAAARHFGNDLLHKVKDVGADVTVLYDRLDPVTNTKAIRDLADKLRGAGSAGPKRCVFPFTMHSMLSTYDDIDGSRGTKYWMKEMTCHVVAYLADGTPYPQTDETDADEQGEKICSLACTAETCPYDYKDKTPPTCDQASALELEPRAPVLVEQPARPAEARVVQKREVRRALVRQAQVGDRAEIGA